MVIASFALPFEAVALEQTFQDVPDLEVEVERIAAHSTEWVMPCLWMVDGDFNTVDEALANDSSVNEIVETNEYADEKYYQLDWSDEVKHRIDTFLDMEASILDASADANGWRVRIRFTSREQFETFRDYLSDRGISFDLLDITEPGAPRQTYGEITPDQRDALVAAKEHGYYKIPRETTLRELAKDLDISHQTLSEHLRRGSENLIDATLTTEGEPVQ